MCYIRNNQWSSTINLNLFFIKNLAGYSFYGFFMRLNARNFTVILLTLCEFMVNLPMRNKKLSSFIEEVAVNCSQHLLNLCDQIQNHSPKAWFLHRFNLVLVTI